MLVETKRVIFTVCILSFEIKEFQEWSWHAKVSILFCTVFHRLWSFIHAFIHSLRPVSVLSSFLLFTVHLSLLSL